MSNEDTAVDAKRALALRRFTLGEEGRRERLRTLGVNLYEVRADAELLCAPDSSSSPSPQHQHHQQRLSSFPRLNQKSAPLALAIGSGRTPLMPTISETGEDRVVQEKLPKNLSHVRNTAFNRMSSISSPPRLIMPPDSSLSSPFFGFSLHRPRRRSNSDPLVALDRFRQTMPTISENLSTSPRIACNLKDLTLEDHEEVGGHLLLMRPAKQYQDHEGDDEVQHPVTKSHFGFLPCHSDSVLFARSTSPEGLFVLDENHDDEHFMPALHVEEESQDVLQIPMQNDSGLNLIGDFQNTGILEHNKLKLTNPEPCLLTESGVPGRERALSNPPPLVMRIQPSAKW